MNGVTKKVISMHPQIQKGINYQHIPSITNFSGNVAHLTSDILCFQEYYRLYNLPSPNIQDTPTQYLSSLNAFLSRTALSKIPVHILNILEEYFTAEELHKAISSIPSGKSPGPDEVLMEELTIPLLKSFNSISSLQQFLSSCSFASTHHNVSYGRQRLFQSYRPSPLLKWMLIYMLSLLLKTEIYFRGLYLPGPSRIHPFQGRLR